jgi:hypothetical protein
MCGVPLLVSKFSEKQQARSLAERDREEFRRIFNI